ncbi:MAG: hypothetical protein J7M19_06005 [Planctomycetes bacterium]|nr:hypothetical protein [Planctomycetota bacterium]
MSPFVEKTRRGAIYRARGVGCVQGNREFSEIHWWTSHQCHTVFNRAGASPFAKAVLTMLLAAMLSGCISVARLFPPSEEQTTFEQAVEENARLKKMLKTETQLNHTLAYKLEVARIDLQKAQAAVVAKEASAADEEVAAFQDYEVARVRFGLLTGPSNWDDKPGLDGFRVYLIVEDSEGTTLKRKGNCIFDLIDISRRRERVIMSWAVPAEVLGSYWQSLPPGFRVKLPWQAEVPWGDEVVLRGTFTNAYGRQFSASRVFRLEREVPVEKAQEETEPGK